jgi:hypothetical protein
MYCNLFELRNKNSKNARGRWKALKHLNKIWSCREVQREGCIVLSALEKVCSLWAQHLALLIFS